MGTVAARAAAEPAFECEAERRVGFVADTFRHSRQILVLMGGSPSPVPLNYLQVMFNNLEIIGNFMHAQNAYLPLLALVRSGRLDLRAIRPKVFALSDLLPAMEAALAAGSLELVIVTSQGETL